MRIFPSPAPFLLFVLLALITALQAWGAEPQSRSVAEWAAELRAPNPKVRSNAATAIGRMGPAAAQAVPDLAAALGDADTEVQANAAWALAQMGKEAKSAVPALEKALGDANWQVRGRAAVALGALGTEAGAAREALRRALNDGNANVRAAAAGALWSVTGDATEPLPALKGLLSNPDAHTRRQAAQALARVGPPAAVLAPQLIAKLDDSDSGVRLAAARALMPVGRENAAVRDALEKRLAVEREPVVREAMASTLDQLRKEPASGPAGRHAEPREATGVGPAAGKEEAAGAPEPAAATAGAPAEPTAKAGQPSGGGAPGAEPAGASPPRSADAEGGAEARPAAKAPAAPRQRPPEPAYEGRTLTEWIVRLDGKDVGERRLACVALGEIGPPARPAVGPLNRLRLYDTHDMVRHQAAYALARILGVALGDMLPRPPAPAKGAGESAGPPPEGRIFYLFGVHSVSEKGVEPRPDLTRRDTTYRQFLFGFTNGALNYLDLAEAHKYREDARTRGLNVALPLPELLKSEPEAERDRIRKEYTFFYKYKKDYIVRITCNRQTRYAYYRWIGDEYDSYGSGSHWAMTPGRYVAEITVWVRDGFRLDYEAPFTCTSDVYTAGGDHLQAAKAHGPQDLAGEEREYEASITPGNTDYSRRMFPGRKAGATKRIGERIAGLLSKLANCQPMMPDEILPYIRESLVFYDKAARIDPAAHKTRAGDLSMLVDVCAMAASRDTYAMAIRLIGMLEKVMADPESKSSQAELRNAHHDRAVCYMKLADLALTYQMDIPASLRFRIEALRYKELADGTFGDVLRSMDVEKKMTEWPQPDWWNPAWDERQPPVPAELTEEGEGKGEEAAEPRENAEQEVAVVNAQELEEAVAEVDEERAEQVSWLIQLRGQMTSANAELGAALAKLVALHRALLAVEQKMSYFGKLLGEASARPDDADWFEEQIFNAIRNSEAIRDDLAGQARGGAEAMRAVLKKIVDDLSKRQAELEGERTAIIQDAMLNYASIAQSLEKRGPQCSEPAMREVAENTLHSVRTIMALRKAELYTAAGMGDEFRVAARECIEAGGEAFDYQVRLMESAHMESQGKLSLALKAARLALDARKESAEPPRKKLADGTEVRVPTPAQALVKRLELDALEAITAKTARDSTMVRKMCEQQIGVHGDRGVTGFAYDVLFMGRFISAVGDNNLVDSFHSWITGPAGRPFWGTPIEKEETLAGKPESQSREMGFVLDDATRTTLGLNMIRKLREHDVPFSKIGSMSAAEFRRVVAETLGREPLGERWKSLTDAQVSTMRSELHFAMQQADVERLMEGKSQVLDLESGKSYYDTESFTGNWRDAVEDQVNVANLLLFALPNAQVARAGRQVGLLKWAGPAAGGGESVALKQAFSEAIGVGRGLKWISEHKLGGRIVADLVDTHSRMSWFGQAMTDSMIQSDVTQMARYGTEYVVGRLGYDEVTQEKAGRVAEVLTQIGTSFAGDLDVTVGIARDVLNPAQARVIGESLAGALKSADEMAEIAESHQRILRKALAETDGGRITPENQRLVKAAAEGLEEQMDSLRKALPEAGSAHPIVNEHYDRLQALFDGLQGAADGMASDAKRFSAFAEDLAERLAESRTSLVRQISVVQGAGKPLATKQDLAGRPLFNDDVDFRTPSALPIADELAQKGQYTQASKLYEAGYYVYDELGMSNNPAAQILAKRWRLAKQLDQAQDFFARMRANPDPNLAMARPISEAELENMRKSPDFRLVPIGKGASTPYWVEIAGTRAGVFKPARADFPFGREAERIGANFAKELDIPAAAAARTTMPLEQDMQGAFARYFEAAEAQGLEWRRTVDDLLQLKSKGKLEFVPVGAEAPDTFWAVSEGRRVGLFTPEYARLPQGTSAQDLFERIAKASGGEVLETVPTTMRMKEADGVFVRFIEGQDLINFTDAERIVLKREVAKDWVLRLLIGDYDAHALNFKVAPNAEVIPLDRNLADILEIREGMLQRVLGTSALSTNPPEMQIEIEKLMRARLQILCGRVGGNNRHYQCMGRIAEQMTYEDFKGAVEKVQKWDRDFLRKQVGDAMGGDTERALDVLEARVRCMKKVLEALPEVMTEPVTSFLPRCIRWPVALRSPEEVRLLAA